MGIRTTKHTSGYWRATIDSPPLNLFDQPMTEDLQRLMDELENDSDVKMVVFDSADPEYFISHLDLAKIDQLSTEPGVTGLSPWPDVAVRLERAPFVTPLAFSADVREASEANFCRRWIFGLQAANGRSCRRSSLGPALFRAAAVWSGFHC